MANEPTWNQTPQDDLHALIRDPDLEHLEDLLAEFNLFDVLGIARRELQHSALLGWLLNPKGSHGLRNYFLHRFLSQAAAETRENPNISPLEIDGWKLNDVEVATERHNIDILLVGRNDGFVCLIENKIGAGEHSQQLKRYLTIVRERYADLTPFPIFLTPDGREPNADNAKDGSIYWTPLGYDKIAGLIERTLKTRGTTISASVTSFLEQYASTLGRHVLGKDNIDELAYRIYSNHKEAIDLIIQSRPGSNVEGWSVIDEVIEQKAPGLRVDSKSKGYHQFYAPEIDEIPELKQGSGWTRSGRMLLFQVNYQPGTLALIIGPGPEETRARIFDLVQRDQGVPGVRMRPSKKLSGTWHTVYSKPLIKRGSSEPNYEESRPQVEQAIADFFDKDYPPIVKAIRSEFGFPTDGNLVS